MIEWKNNRSFLFTYVNEQGGSMSSAHVMHIYNPPELCIERRTLTSHSITLLGYRETTKIVLL